jgi:hypothetical protein
MTTKLVHKIKALILSGLSSSIIVCLTAAFLLSGCSASRSSNLVGQRAPLSRITDMDGQLTSMGKYIGSGAPTVIVFWATTCRISPRAVEKLDGMAKRLKPRGVQFLAVNIDKASALDDVKNMIKYRDMGNLQHFFSGNDVYDEAYISYQGDEIPLFVVIDATGNIVATGHKASIVEEYFKLPA